MRALTRVRVAGGAVGASYALAGMGLVVLERGTGERNFAFGAIAASAAMVTWQAQDWGLHIWLACIVGIFAAAAISGIYGGLISARVAQRSDVVKAVATLGLALILLGLSLYIWGDTPRRLRLPLRALNTELFGVRITGARLLAALFCIVAAIGITAILTKTRIGLQMRALADTRDLSALIGIDVGRVTLIAWIGSGVLAGIAGIFLGSLVRLDPGVLTFMVVPCMAAAILGGLKSLWLTLLGGLVIGLIEAGITPFQSIAPYRTLAPFVIAIAVLMIVPARTFSRGRAS